MNRLDLYDPDFCNGLDLHIFDFRYLVLSWLDFEHRFNLDRNWDHGRWRRIKEHMPLDVRVVVSVIWIFLEHAVQ